MTTAPGAIPGLSVSIRGGAKEDRTPDLVDANDALSQLSYGPTVELSLSNCRMLAKPARADRKWDIDAPVQPPLEETDGTLPPDFV